MTNNFQIRHCSYCDKVFTLGRIFFRIKDGDKILHLHGECVPLMSGGVELKNIEKECGVEWLNNMEQLDRHIYYFDKDANNVSLHRLDGPAIENENMDNGYYFKGLRCSSIEDWELRMEILNTLNTHSKEK